MKTIGTVLPTAKSIKVNNAFAKREARDKERIARTTPELVGCERREMRCGEVRYYDTTDQYAIISRRGDVLWFQVTADGDMRI